MVRDGCGVLLMVQIAYFYLPAALKSSAQNQVTRLDESHWEWEYSGLGVCAAFILSAFAARDVPLSPTKTVQRQ